MPQSATFVCFLYSVELSLISYFVTIFSDREIENQYHFKFTENMEIEKIKEMQDDDSQPVDSKTLGKYYFFDLCDRLVCVFVFIH